MSVNESIAQRLEEMSKMLEVLGEDSFRVLAHARAARAVASAPVDLATICHDKKELQKLEGIGPRMADKIIEFCTTGAIKEHAELAAKVPTGVLELMQVPAIGPKTAHAMWKEVGIDSVAKLEAAIADGSIMNVPRMGAKTVDKIKDSIALAKSAGGRMRLGQAQHIAERFLERLRASPLVAQATAAGSLRRGRETIGDIDILVALKKGHENDALGVVDVFTKTPGVVQTLSAGESKSSVRCSLIGMNEDRWTIEGTHGQAGGPSVQVDLRVLPLASWGAALIYFTGSKDHNVRLRSRALDLGLTLNDWGLYPIDEEKTAPHLRGVKSVAGATEDEVYAKLGLAWIPPEIREDSGEIDAAESGATPATKAPAKSETTAPKKAASKTPKNPKPVASTASSAPGNPTTLPDLVGIADIKAELHAHTVASDGALSIESLIEEAIKRGFHTIAVTDHSKSSFQANGLSVDRLLAHVDAVHAARDKFANKITVLAGSEVDILTDGTLDYDDATLAKLDIVVASPHAALAQNPEAATKRLLAAIAHPRVNILGHPTGRLINRRKGLEPDMAKLFAAARQHNVALEVNAHWMRLDLRDTHVKAATDAGCLIAIDCDVHEVVDFDNLKFGVATARRGWCTRSACINAWDAKQLHAWIKAKR